MIHLHFPDRINWGRLVALLLPGATAAWGIIWGVLQYVDNSAHERAATYLSVYEKFGATKEDFDKNFGLIAQLVLDHGRNSAGEKALGGCFKSEVSNWSDMVACFNHDVEVNRYSSLMAVAGDFVALAQYARSDSHAGSMLTTALNYKASILASQFCHALKIAQVQMNLLHDSDDPDKIWADPPRSEAAWLRYVPFRDPPGPERSPKSTVIDAVNLFSAVKCDCSTARRQDIDWVPPGPPAAKAGRPERRDDPGGPPRPGASGPSTASKCPGEL